MTPEQQDQVDGRFCIMMQALGQVNRTEIEDYLADEWAALEIAALVIAPLYELDPRDEPVRTRLQRAAHAAMKFECEEMRSERSRPPLPLDPPGEGLRKDEG